MQKFCLLMILGTYNFNLSWIDLSLTRYLEADEMERTFKFSQNQIIQHVDALSAEKVRISLVLLSHVH